MRFMVEDIEVQFPYPRIYPEQYAYMLELKRSLDAKGHSMLEMPTGTGKTITLLSLITSYQRVHRETMGKLIYCTRTIPEMEKVLEELSALEAYRDECFGSERPERLLGCARRHATHGRSPNSGHRADRALCPPHRVGLSSRRNLCVHERVSMQTERHLVDQECRQLTASWVRERAKGASGGDAGGPSSSAADEEEAEEEREGGGGELCSYYEALEAPLLAENASGGSGHSCAPRRAVCAAWKPAVAQTARRGPSQPRGRSASNRQAQGTDASLPRGVFTLEQLKEHAKARGFCPYFLARHAIQLADVVVYNYQYLLDPKISTLVSSSMQARRSPPRPQSTLPPPLARHPPPPLARHPPSSRPAFPGAARVRGRLRRGAQH